MLRKAFSSTEKVCRRSANIRSVTSTVANEDRDPQRLPGQIDDSPLKDYMDVPGPKPLPFIGSLHKYAPYIGEYSFAAMFDSSLKRFREFGPLVREVIVGKISVLHIYDPNDIETVLRFSGKYPERRSHLAMGLYRKAKPEMYKNGGILTENGEDWWKLRKLFQKPITSPKSARNYLGRTDIFISEFVDRVKRVYCKNNSITDDFLKDLNRLNLQIVSLIIFDEKIDCFSEAEMRHDSMSTNVIESTEFINKSSVLVDALVELIKYVELPIYKNLCKSLMILESVVTNFISKKMNTFKNMSEEDLGKEQSLLQMYLANPDIDFKDLMAMSIDLLLGGIDTTSNTSSFALYNLATNPEVQEKLYKESLELLPNYDDPITEEILNNAVYLKAFLKESLRLHPISVGIGRLLTQDVALSGYKIPKGTTIVTHNQVACRQEKYFNKPLELIPERWMKTSELYSQHHPFLYTPFGHGSRMCIARRFAEQNMHITLLKMVRNFEIIWKGVENLGIETVMINKPNAAIKLKLKLRPNVNI